jgi:two-component system CheB/CheR fusion protein
MSEHNPAFEALLQQLKEARSFDFTGYKRTTLMRRVQRRMQTLGIKEFDEYNDYLQVHQDEFTQLLDTILINVTSFFRDPDSWAYLASEIVPEVLARRPEGPIRIWSAGCASGEEAYSLAMVFAEALGVEAFRDRVKIYATDVDEEALRYARLACFTPREATGVSPERLETFFEDDGGRYCFSRDLRRSVIFGRNDLVQDAPISHLDLLVCRNTLMYFNAQTQAQIINRLHFALSPHGVLFLGKAELLLSHAALFTPIEVKRRFFRRVSAEDAIREGAAAFPAQTSFDADAPPAALQVLRDQALLSSPTAQIVVDRGGRLAFSNHRADSMFALGRRHLGQPFQDLEVSYRPIELRSAIDASVSNREASWHRGVDWGRTAGEQKVLDVQVVPLLDDTGGVLGTTVIFHDVTQQRHLQAELEYANRRLETAYEELQSSNEELETKNEELQSTVEELETTNEELQSTNEELETMNEELQSMNDELQGANESLRQRTAEVDQLNRFMETILASLQSGVVVVNPHLTVTAWNKPAQELWGVRSDEAVGQPLLNLDIDLPLDRLKSMLRSRLAGSGDHHGVMVLDAVNRRGKPVSVQVTVSQLLGEGDDVTGAILVMDVVGSGSAEPVGAAMAGADRADPHRSS